MTFYCFSIIFVSFYILLSSKQADVEKYRRNEQIMETIQNNPLSNQEKTLIAMGAAMGAGCRTCADKLYETAGSLNIPRTEMLRAFLLGLDAKQAAVKTMQEKISGLLANGQSGEVEDFPENLAFLIRMASFTAANSAPDCIREMDKAAQTGIPAEHVQLCITTGKMVRSHAMEFSDKDISNKFSGSELNAEGTCCSGTTDTQNASGCSCC